MEEAHKEQVHHDVGYGVFILVWALLLVLTGVTVWVAGLELGKFSLMTAVLIASCKATLVVWFFMHLKYEPPVFKVMVFVTILTLTVIILMTFFDVWYR